MTRMSSPDGSEILTVGSEVGAAVLASLGWSTEGGSSRSRRSEPVTPKTESAEAVPEERSSAESGEAPRKRGPGRPRKHPVEGE